VTTLTFLGAAGTVTGSKFALELDGRVTLVDCGLFQGRAELRARNWQTLPRAAASISDVLLTHAHIDHSGYLPRLMKQGFRGDVLATHGTRDLLRVLLPDSGHLQEEEARYRNEARATKHLPALPLYTAAQGREAEAHVTGVDWEQRVPLGERAMATFRRAGHILGAAAVHVDITTSDGVSRIVFSGDVGRYDQPILRDPAPLGEADWVVVESTYGDRRHDPTPTATQFERVLHEAVARGGAVVIPAFAVGRTQDVLYELSTLEKAGRIPRLRVYLDSPMAIDATEIYAAHPEEFDADMNARLRAGVSPLRPADFHLARTPADSRAINGVTGPVVVISASGMATGGRVLHHLRRRLPDPRNTILLVGYQVEGTRGRSLEDGASWVKIFGEVIPVRARIETIQGLSAHADADGILRWLRTATRRPKGVFVVHGEPAAAGTLAARIHAELGWPASVPKDGETVVLN